jgi:hypothetical protein
MEKWGPTWRRRLLRLAVPVTATVTLHLSCGERSIESMADAPDATVGGTPGVSTGGSTGATTGSGLGGTAEGGGDGQGLGGEGASGGSGGAGGGGNDSGGSSNAGGRHANAGALGTGNEGGGGGDAAGPRPNCDAALIHPGTTTFDQQDVEGLWGVTEIVGDLAIQDAKSLRALSCLERVGGGLYVGPSPKLESLDGLERLTSVRGALRLSALPLVESLAPLGRLTDIGRYLEIRELAAVVSLEGLESIRSVGERVSIASNESLTTLAGFPSLPEFESGIYSNGSLQNLGALEGVTRLARSLYLFNNGLSDYSAFANLTEVVGRLSLDENTGGLEGLERLRTVSEQLVLGGNFSSLGALSSLEFAEGLSLSSSRLETLSELGPSWVIDGDLEIEAPALTTLSGIERPSVSGGVTLKNCTSLSSLTGLAGATFPGGVHLHDLDLTTLDGIEGTSLEGGLTLHRNPRLESLAALSDHTSLGHLRIFANPALSTLAGLDNVTSIAGNLQILGHCTEECWVDDDGEEVCTRTCERNTMLKSVRALSGLQSVGGEFAILENPSLPSCEAVWLRDNVGIANIGGTISIIRNADSGACPL